ncbi:thiol-disulfide oxidoreductase DCC family protein [Fervidibacillus halotolerans]|uniref:DUF393 domain-containing protein n=1 Tax=Fervidibacillus halotolerans TaxID=2980027 RepID=A0A9E8M258_9BACI|nr:DUF393 domain-containing protein [Fervidibacillus halotolerans]WAA12924.1 DUF393 domain-containing protein [Fervidibacillus halotolerans]
MHVLIYDGECSVCSRLIRFIVRFNSNPNLRITDLQSDWTKKNCPDCVQFDSVIFFYNEKQYLYSDAIIHLLATIHPFFKPMLVCKMIPVKFRDGLYKFIAKRRKQILKNQCPVMDKKMRDLFLT